MSVCTTVMSTRSFVPSSDPSPPPNHQSLTAFRVRGVETDEATLEGIVFGTGARWSSRGLTTASIHPQCVRATRDRPVLSRIEASERRTCVAVNP